MTYTAEGDQAIHSVADLVEHDFDGSELPSAATVRETLEKWRQNSAAARSLIDGLTLRTATVRYLLAWTQAYEAEYETEEPLAPDTCPACGGPVQELGGLGRLTWYRCRNCGHDTSRGE